MLSAIEKFYFVVTIFISLCHSLGHSLFHQKFCQLGRKFSQFVRQLLHLNLTKQSFFLECSTIFFFIQMSTGLHHYQIGKVNFTASAITIDKYFNLTTLHNVNTNAIFPNHDLCRIKFSIRNLEPRHSDNSISGRSLLNTSRRSGEGWDVNSGLYHGIIGLAVWCSRSRPEPSLV